MKLKSLFLSMLVIFCSAFAYAEEEVEEPSYYLVNAPTLNLRSKPSTSGKKLTTYIKNTFLTSNPYGETAPGWVCIVADVNGHFVDGFVKRQFLKELIPCSFPNNMPNGEYSFAADEENGLIGNMVYTRKGDQFEMEIAYYSTERTPMGGLQLASNAFPKGVCHDGWLEFKEGLEDHYNLFLQDPATKEIYLYLDDHLWKIGKIKP